MRKKQCATRRIAGSDDEEGEEPSAASPEQQEADQQASESDVGFSSEMLGISGQSTGLNGRLDDGTVIVQPEAAGDDSVDIAIVEDNSRSSGKINRLSLSLTPGIYDTVKCTACGKKVNPYNGTMQLHPMLRVLVCQKCYRFYSTGQFDIDNDGKENQCRWCGEGGSLICCDKCQHSFCKTCIKRNLGRTALQAIEDLPDEAIWSCYACDQSGLKELQEEAGVVMKAVQDHYKEASKRSEKHKTALAGKLRPARQQQQQQLAQLQQQQLLAAGRQGSTASMMGLKLDLSAVPKAGSMPLLAPKIGQQQQQQLAGRQQRVSIGQASSQLVGQQRQQPGGRQQNSSVITEQWYKKNVKIESILADIESVNAQNIGTALNATVALLQGMMRQYSKFLQDLALAKSAVFGFNLQQQQQFGVVH